MPGAPDGRAEWCFGRPVSRPQGSAPTSREAIFMAGEGGQGVALSASPPLNASRQHEILSSFTDLPSVHLPDARRLRT